MFSCKESISVLLQYLDGDMPEAEAQRLDEHFRACSPCVEFLQTYRATPGLCRKALAKKMPEELADRLTSFLREKCRKP